MRVRNLTLAMVAVMAWGVPARADILLNWHLSTQAANPSDTAGTPITSLDVPLGPALTGPQAAIPNSVSNPLIMTPGQVILLQLAVNCNATPAGAGQNNWKPLDTNGVNGGPNPNNTLIGWGFDVQYPLALCVQPFNTAANNTRNATANNYTDQPDGPGNADGSTFGITLTPPFNAGVSRLGGLDLGNGLGVQSGGGATPGILSDWVICTFKIRASATPTGPQPLPITLADTSLIPTASAFGLGDGTNLDSIVFSAAHGGQNSFPLFIQVNAVPEPSSMCLAGLAIAGFGWRKLRRKATAAV
jgi:PEP-CTERM motif